MLKKTSERLLKAKAPRAGRRRLPAPSAADPASSARQPANKTNGASVAVARRPAAAASAAALADRGHASVVTGFVDRLAAGVIEGWALDRLDLSRRLHVRAIADGKEIGSAVCDVYREDIQMSGAGDGRYGFRIEYSGPPIPPERIAIVVTEADPPHRLPLSPQAQIDTAAPVTPPMKAVAYIGFVEQVSAGELAGWALDRSDLSKRTRIRVTSNGRLLGSVHCDLFREDLLKSGAGDGRYGFRIPFDPSVPIDEITVAVDDAAGPFRLPFTPDAAAALRYLQDARRALQTPELGPAEDRTTETSNDALAILQAQVQTLQAEIARFKGALNQSIGNLARQGRAEETLAPLAQEIGRATPLPPEQVSWRARGIYRQLLRRLEAGA